MSKEQDNQELGMNVGTASNALRKQLLFSLAKELGRNYCYRCDGSIDLVENFSIDHKVPWRRSPKAKELFFDLNNIAFSHNRCNTAAARKKLADCGTATSYVRGCRCDECREAHAEKARDSYCKDYRHKRYLKFER